MQLPCLSLENDDVNRKERWKKRKERAKDLSPVNKTNKLLTDFQAYQEVIFFTHILV